MTQKTADAVYRKLAVPIQIKMGVDTIVTDGLFSLTSKETSQINIIGQDGDGYTKIQILPPQKPRSVARNSLETPDGVLIGTESSRSRGRGKEFGQYKYYRKADCSYYARVFSGDESRPYQLGRLADRSSPISMIARSIAVNFGKNEFSKIQLAQILEKSNQKNIAQGQILKSGLDILKLEGYLERRELSEPQGRLKERFKATNRLAEVIIVTPEQA